MKLSDLNKDSTPCEICVAITGREIEKNENRYYWDGKYCERFFHGKVETNINFYGGIDVLGSACIEAYRAMIKLLYLNYSKTLK